MSRDPITDLASLESLRLGDSSALNRLIERWQRPLHSYAYRYSQNLEDAEDLVAQTFVRLYQQRERFRPDTNLSAWLFTTLTNLCHNHHRWKKRHPSQSLSSHEGDTNPEELAGTGLEGISASHESPSCIAARDEEVEMLRAHIDRLPPDLKSALLLHHYEHLSYAEIGDILGCSERGVETRLYRARRRLRDALRPKLDLHP